MMGNSLSGSTPMPSPPCDKCSGYCCKSNREVSVELTEGEEELFPEAVKVSNGLGEMVYGIPNVGGQCMHLGEDDRCTIYDRRPELCRDYSCLWSFRGEERLCGFIFQDNPRLYQLVCAERPEFAREQKELFRELERRKGDSK